MRGSRRGAVLSLSFVALTSGTAHAQPDTRVVSLVVDARRPMEIALEDRVTIRHVGQPVTGTVVNSVYAYDRIVVPAGTRVLGHVARIDPLSKARRLRAILNGDLTPTRGVLLQFDTLMLSDDRSTPIQTIVRREIPHFTRSTAPDEQEDDDTADAAGAAARARREATARAKSAIGEAKTKARAAIEAVTQPGRMDRLKDAAIQRLPYHPQFLQKGTVYSVEITASIDFGSAVAAEHAADARPTPSSLLNVRLATVLDSSATPRGTPVEAVVTVPVFTPDQRLIFPEGTRLKGEVTFARRARRFHRNGQLRFLFETVEAPGATGETADAPLVAALHGVETSADERLALDDEGGTKLSDPKTRLIAPALALLALRANADHDHHRFDNDADDTQVGSIGVHSGNAASRGVGGFLGLSVLGFGLSQVSRPVGLALSAFGAARTVYANILGKGRDVHFAADTAMQLRLAPRQEPVP